MSGHVDYVTDLVRRMDRARFVTALFAPAAKRDQLLALYAFDLEIGRIPGTVSEPMLGQIRLQWWRDLVEKLAAGGSAPEGHPVSQALTPVAASIDKTLLLALIEAREPTSPTVPATTQLAQAALAVLDVTDTPTCAAAHEAAIAYGIAAGVALNDEARAHVRDHLIRARAYRAAIDTRALPVMLWATVAEARLTQRDRPPPILRLTWNAWRGRY